MTSLRKTIPAILAVFLAATCTGGAAFADSSHARIVRLSLVQGDVRFARDVKGDPLGDSQLTWETAVLNLPIRQGYVVATDNGRAEVEFENGAMAFLAENTVLQFFDLSSEDGGFTTRLILRQGSAEFYVNPGHGDYFSVTGGDFSVQAETKTTFRMNNFDDGSSADVLHGRLTALTKGKDTVLEKGQALTMRAGEPDSAQVARVPESDEFDQWVSGRIDSAATATAATMQYSNNDTYDYTSGYGDLYTYGSWFPVAGYGNCWRPYGVGLGWGPFDYGSWYYDSYFGWAFLGGYSWGWLPYHYGGWLFQPGLGWVWSPAGTLGGVGVGRWRPVTGVWMRSSTGTVGIVPSHPLDVHGKTPLNLSQGLYAVTPGGVTGQIAANSDERWKVENKPGREVMQSQLAEASAPTRVSRAMAASTAANGRVATGDSRSSIVYDRTEGRFVNTNKAPVSEGRSTEASSGNAMQARKGVMVYPGQNPAENPKNAPVVPDRTNTERQQRQVVPSNRTVPSPPSVPHSVTMERGFNMGGGTGPHGGVSAAGGSSAGAGARASAPAASGGARGGGGGGRAH